MNESFVDIVNNSEKIPIFIDLSNIMYRSMFVFKPDRFTAPNGEPNGHLYGLCQLLKSCYKKGYLIFLCADNRCSWRTKLNEGYKGNRDHSDRVVDFYKQYDLINDLISALPDCYFLSYKDTEADDIIYTCSSICSKMGRKNFIFSKDKDLFQALDEYTTIIYRVLLGDNEEVRYRSEEYNKSFPLEPKYLPYFRSIRGDVSDNIKPIVERFPKELAVDVSKWMFEKGIDKIGEYQTTKDSQKKWINILITNIDQFKLNFDLIKLKECAFDIHKKIELKNFGDLCEDYGLYQYLSFINSIKYLQNLNK